MKQTIEILAPAGNFDSLKAAVRSGADAVYLGGEELSARNGANTFDKTLLREAVSYCRAREVKVYQAINTLIFDDELKKAENLIEQAAWAGVDAFIVQDLAVAKIARYSTPNIELHASTQMSVHNLHGVEKLCEMGFSRVVLARELTLGEINHIAKNSPIEIECFVHGALCMSVSGQCYLSSMIGGRSGNRGRCAQTCRLPFQSGKNTHALSLKDLSVVDYLPELAEIGVKSFKIEGRLKRPEYVAATVTACKEVLSGKTPDYSALQSVFSRSGFTKGYLENNLGDEMFGTRTKEDVTATKDALQRLELLYKDEKQTIPLSFGFTMKNKLNAVLTVSNNTNSIEVIGDVPQVAISAPTTFEKVETALAKLGGTPYYLDKLDCELDDGLMMPVSQLNQMRRQAVESLLSIAQNNPSKQFRSFEWRACVYSRGEMKKRGRFSSAEQLDKELVEQFDRVIIPIDECFKLERFYDNMILELPKISFSESAQASLIQKLEQAKSLGYTEVMVGGLDTINTAKALGFTAHGDFNLNITNSISAEEYLDLGLVSTTLSIEYPIKKQMPANSGIIIYGTLPLMSFRNSPAGQGSNNGFLTDRLGNRFRVNKEGEVSVLYNSVPLYLGDKLEQYSGFDFVTFYFTDETNGQCKNILKDYEQSSVYEGEFTRGLYKGKVK